MASVKQSSNKTGVNSDFGQLFISEVIYKIMTIKLV